MKQGDFNLYCEPGGAFAPLGEYEAAQITVHEINELFEGECSLSYSSAWEIKPKSLAGGHDACRNGNADEHH